MPVCVLYWAESGRGENTAKEAETNGLEGGKPGVRCPVIRWLQCLKEERELLCTVKAEG